jgi:DNA-binding transcriptional LysR family regulator
MSVQTMVDVNEQRAAGLTFYARAQTILRDAQRAVVEAQAVEAGEAGTVTIGIVSSAAISVLPKLLHYLCERLLRAAVELRELPPGEQIEALYRDKLDLGFFHAQLQDEIFNTVIVARERLLAALPSESPLTQHQRVDLKDLAQETVIMPARYTTPGYFELARATFHSVGVLPERIYHTNLLQTGLLLVGAGVGVSLVPESFKRVQVKGVA